MAHARKAIRDQVVSTLTGLTTTGSNVFRNRVYPIADGKLPGLLIYTNSEEVETATMRSPRTQLRNLEIIIEAFVKGVSNYDDTLDTIAEEVEEALAADITLNGLAKDVMVTAFEADFSGEGDQPVAVGRTTITVMYATLENAVDTSV